MRRGLALLAACVAAYGAALAAIAGLASRIPSAQGGEPSGGRLAVVVFYTDDPAAWRRRVETGVREFRDRDAVRLVMTGGWRPDRGYHGGAEMRAAAAALGVPPERLLTDRTSNDSRSNFRQSLEALARDGLPGARLALVSDRLHLLRLSLIAWLDGVGGVALLVPTAESIAESGGFARLNHELAGYLALVLPEGWTRPILALLRSG